MSTRSQIGIYDGNDQPVEKYEALLYRHSDGYPSGVLPDIMPFLSWWSKGRGINDTEYVSARLLQYLANKFDQNSIGFHEQMKGKFPPHAQQEQEIKDTKEFTGIYGHGICNKFHWDIEYFYAIAPEGVTVYECGDMEKMEMKKIGLIPYDNYEKNKDYKKLIKE